MSIEDYIAPDGGGMLHPNDKATLDGQPTTANQNPILFLAYMARATWNPTGWWDFWKPWVGIHAASTTVGPGRFLRRKGDPLRQSHDNVLAWAWWSVLLRAHWAEEIYNFAKWRLFVYDPHKKFSLDPRCILQGSQVFTLKLAANRKPGWLTTLWFTGACIVQDHSADSYLKSMLCSDIVRERMNLLSKTKQNVVRFGLDLMEKRREKMARWYREYYRDDPNHPAVLAEQEHEKNGG